MENNITFNIRDALRPREPLISDIWYARLGFAKAVNGNKIAVSNIFFFFFHLVVSFGLCMYSSTTSNRLSKVGGESVKKQTKKWGCVPCWTLISSLFTFGAFSCSFSVHSARIMMRFPCPDHFSTLHFFFIISPPPPPHKSITVGSSKCPNACVHLAGEITSGRHERK